MADVTNESGLREKIARALQVADNSKIPDGYAEGLPDDISDWGAFVADAILALISPAGEVETEPFAYFQFNEAWGSWEQVVPEAANRPGVVAAYRSAAPMGMEG